MIDLPARGSELSAPGTDQEHNIDPACCLQSRTNYWKDMDKYWQILAILTILTLPVACNQEQFTNIGEYRQIFFMQPKYWYVSNEIIVAISHWKSWTLTPFNYQRISAWKYSPWIFVCMKIFAMNIYMGIFTRNININMFMNIYRTGLTSSGWICWTQEYSRQTPCSCTAALKRTS